VLLLYGHAVTEEVMGFTRGVFSGTGCASIIATAIASSASSSDLVSPSAVPQERLPTLEDIELVAPVGGFSTCDRPQRILLNSLRLFWPRARLALLFDDTPEGHALAASCKHNGRNVFVTAAGSKSKRGKFLRFVVDQFSSARYIGLVDDDTLFTTPIVASSIFDVDGRPFVRGLTGPPQSSYWEVAQLVSDRILVGKAMPRFMSYFPVVVHNAHFAALRRFVLEKHGQELASILQEKDNRIFSELSILMGYAYLYHRHWYSWIVTEIHEGQETFAMNQPLWLSMAQHLGYTPGGGTMSDPVLVDARLAEGYCRASGSKSESCKVFTKGSLHLDLFRFEHLQWILHPNASRAQEEHYARARMIAPIPTQDNEKWVHRAALLLGDANFEFPTRILHASLSSDMDQSWIYPTEKKWTYYRRHEVVDFSQCFLAAGLVHTVRMVAAGNMDNMNIRAVLGEKPWTVRRASSCQIVEHPSRPGVSHCHLSQLLPVFPGECIGWVAEGQVIYTPTLGESRAGIRNDRGPLLQARAHFLLSAIWREVPFVLPESRKQTKSARRQRGSHT